MTHNYTAIKLIPIEPLNDAHGALIVDAFNRLFVINGGTADGYGGWGGGGGDGWGGVCGYGDGDGTGGGNDDIPKEWRV
jgi:hypothetical protein